MIDQTKDKKDNALEAKLEAKQELKNKPVKTRKAVETEKENVEIAKDDKVKAVKEQAGSNAAQAVQPIGMARIVEDKAAVHSAPEQQGALLNNLSAQRQIDILAVEGEELKVLVDGKVGYIAANATDYASAPKAEEKQVQAPAGSVRVSATALRIHTAPGRDESYIGTLRQADCVNYYGEKDGYLEVHIGDQIGYISAEHTDYDGEITGTARLAKDSSAYDQAPDELREILSKDALTSAEISSARGLIAQCAENLRPELYESLQAKSKAEEAQADGTADGEFASLAASLEMIGVQNPQTDKTYAAYLAQLRRTQHLPENGGMENWGSLANAMGVNYNAICLPGDTQTTEKAFWSEAARAEIQAGKAVMANIDGQAVRIEAIEEDGLVVTLPDNSTIMLDEYEGKAEQKSSGSRGLLAFDKLGDVSMDWVITLG